MISPAQLLNRALSRTTAMRVADRQRVGKEIGGCVLTWVLGSVAEVASIPMWSRHSFEMYPAHDTTADDVPAATDPINGDLNSLLGGYTSSSTEANHSGETKAELKAAIGQGQGKWRSLRATSGIDPAMLIGHTSPSRSLA